MSEKIEDIVRDIRRSQNGNVHTISAKEAYALADRIEAAAKALEADRDNWHRQALDEDARANATHKDYLAVGNMAAMREALNVVIDSIRAFYKIRALKFPKEIKSALENMAFHAVTALEKPPRNCDVGTAKNQSLRFEDFCNLHRSCEKGCRDCPLLNCEPCCELEWAHMPYESEVSHDKNN